MHRVRTDGAGDGGFEIVRADICGSDSETFQERGEGDGLRLTATDSLAAVIRRLVLPLVLVGGVAACGGSDEPAAASVDTAAATTVAAPATTVARIDDDASAPASVPDALRFSAPLVGGGDIEMAALAGRPVLLWFWAPW